MIFLTVGMEGFSFDRLLKSMDEGIRTCEIRKTVFAQTGNSQYVPKLFKYCKFLSFGEMVEFIRKADIIVAHAGVGSTLLCLNLQKIPILFPRRVNLREHLDNHQLEFARQMERVGKVLVAYDEQELVSKVKNYKRLINKLNKQGKPSNRESLLSFLKSIINEESSI